MGKEKDIGNLLVSIFWMAGFALLVYMVVINLTGAL